MKRFLVATSSKNNDVSKKTKNDFASDSADSPHASEEATELDCCDSIEQINVSQSYLFDGKYYNIVSNRMTEKS